MPRAFGLKTPDMDERIREWARYQNILRIKFGEMQKTSAKNVSDQTKELIMERDVIDSEQLLDSIGYEQIGPYQYIVGELMPRGRPHGIFAEYGFSAHWLPKDKINPETVKLAWIFQSKKLGIWVGGKGYYPGTWVFHDGISQAEELLNKNMRKKEFENAVRAAFLGEKMTFLY